MNSARSLSALSAVALAGLAGCASVGPGQYRTASCADLDAAIGRTAKEISAVAVRRGNVRSYDVPFWLLGAGRAKQALVERDARKVEELQAAQNRLTAERDRRCR